jgi:hypothetical protein
LTVKNGGEDQGDEQERQGNDNKRPPEGYFFLHGIGVDDGHLPLRFSCKD